MSEGKGAAGDGPRISEDIDNGFGSKYSPVGTNIPFESSNERIIQQPAPDYFYIDQGIYSFPYSLNRTKESLYEISSFSPVDAIFFILSLTLLASSIVLIVRSNKLYIFLLRYIEPSAKKHFASYGINPETEKKLFSKKEEDIDFTENLKETYGYASAYIISFIFFIVFIAALILEKIIYINILPSFYYFIATIAGDLIRVFCIFSLMISVFNAFNSLINYYTISTLISISPEFSRAKNPIKLGYFASIISLIGSLCSIAGIIIYFYDHH